jgi:hypothetical protein
MDAAMRLKDEPSEFGVFFSGRAEDMEGLPLACLNPRCSSGTKKRNKSGIC